MLKQVAGKFGGWEEPSLSLPPSGRKLLIGQNPAAPCYQYDAGVVNYSEMISYSCNKENEEGNQRNIL